MIEFIQAHKSDFAWTHHDILRIDLTVIVYMLNIDQKEKLVTHKRRSFNTEKYAAINPEVEKLIKA